MKRKEVRHRITKKSKADFLNYELSQGASENMMRRYKCTLKSLLDFLGEKPYVTKTKLKEWRAYRRIFTFEKDSIQKTITENKNMLSKNVQVRGYITAAEDISPFSLPEHNQDLFGGIPFSVKRGDILAISENFYNVPLENYDPLADRPSIFSIRRQTERPKDEITVDFMSHDKITIFLNNDVFVKYSALYEAPETRMFLASLFAAPVLVDVLSYIKHADQDMLDAISHLKWYQVLNSRLVELKIDLSIEDSMTKIANMIIPHIFKTNIEQFNIVFKNLLPTTGGEEV